MVDDLKEYPISSNKRNLQEYFSGHVPNGLKQGDVYEDGEHLKKALIKKKTCGGYYIEAFHEG